MEKPSTQEVSISTSAPTPTCLPLPALGETVQAALGPPGLHGEHRTLPQAGVKRWGEIPTHTHTHTRIRPRVRTPESTRLFYFYSWTGL